MTAVTPNNVAKLWKYFILFRLFIYLIKARLDDKVLKVLTASCNRYLSSETCSAQFEPTNVKSSIFHHMCEFS